MEDQNPCITISANGHVIDIDPQWQFDDPLQLKGSRIFSFPYFEPSGSSRYHTSTICTCSYSRMLQVYRGLRIKFLSLNPSLLAQGRDYGEATRIDGGNAVVAGEVRIGAKRTGHPATRSALAVAGP